MYELITRPSEGKGAADGEGDGNGQRGGRGHGGVGKCADEGGPEALGRCRSHAASRATLLLQLVHVQQVMWQAPAVRLHIELLIHAR